MSSATVLAEGEEIVRRYPFTAVDRVALFAGAVVPLPGSIESEGVLTLTNKRVFVDLEAKQKRNGGAGMHQETRLSDISSISSMMSKFGRDLRVPIGLIVLGFVMMFLPYVFFEETGALELDGEYQDGYNAGVEHAYLLEYIDAIKDGRVTHTIPYGYYFSPPDQPWSKEYTKGYYDGVAVGQERAERDIAADAEFVVPSDLFSRSNPSGISLAIAVAGAVVFVMGSVVYVVSNRTKDWVNIRFGQGSAGICVKTFDGGWRGTGFRALTAEDRYWDMTRELGAAIVEIRCHKETRLRVDDDVFIEGEEEEEDRKELPPAPGFEDDDGSDDGMLIIDDNDDGPAIIGPWREGP